MGLEVSPSAPQTCWLCAVPEAADHAQPSSTRDQQVSWAAMLSLGGEASGVWNLGYPDQSDFA